MYASLLCEKRYILCHCLQILQIGCTNPQKSLFSVGSLCWQCILCDTFSCCFCCCFISNRAGYYPRWNHLPVGHRPSHWPSCVHPHLHLHWWSCHHCLLEERWHNAQWWQHLQYRFSSDRYSDSHLHPRTDSDGETGRRVSVQCVQHQDTFRKY